MVSHKVLIRVMGESDVDDVNLIKTAVDAPDGSALWLDSIGLTRPICLAIGWIRNALPP